MSFNQETADFLYSIHSQKNELKKNLEPLEKEIVKGKNLYRKLKDIENKIYEYENHPRLFKNLKLNKELLKDLEENPNKKNKYIRAYQNINDTIYYMENKILAGKELYTKREKINLEIKNYENNKELHIKYQDILDEIKILNKYIFETQKSLINEENRIITEIINKLGELILVKPNYLRLCLQILFCNFPYTNKNLQDILKERYTDSHLNIDLEKYYSMTEKEIIILAHKKYNYFLVRNNGPYYFYHNHGSFKECKYDGWSKRCKCSCKCPEWDTSDVDWLKFNLDNKYPMGKVKCGW
ncbi:hypothetical protein H012_gp526 [Acanthamoeba polyphaga moumouvirus]|uniref:Uncharacterized protein n=2 Tax=Moumouvirus TaxID=3080801 RepID=L7RBN8_9VIRU|nr:hypothetical protein H012_gp526 [Acanthamoeba polyphaga moumouvirus]AGC01934.1 hypothetical protein Moumou_00398 [Acanthamoeba polyphaga moumouvirus]